MKTFKMGEYVRVIMYPEDHENAIGLIDDYSPYDDWYYVLMASDADWFSAYELEVLMR